jgi:hypothetical protein
MSRFRAHSGTCDQILISCPRGFRGATSEWILNPTSGGVHEVKFLLLPLGGLHVKYAVQRGIWVPTQHLVWDQGKPRKTFIELAGRGTSGCKLTSSQQSGIKYANPNTSPYLCCFFFFFLPFLFFSFFLGGGNTFTSCLYKYFICI